MSQWARFFSKRHAFDCVIHITKHILIRAPILSWSELMNFAHVYWFQGENLLIKLTHL